LDFVDLGRSDNCNLPIWLNLNPKALHARALHRYRATPNVVL